MCNVAIKTGVSAFREIIIYGKVSLQCKNLLESTVISHITWVSRKTLRQYYMESGRASRKTLRQYYMESGRASRKTLRQYYMESGRDQGRHSDDTTWRVVGHRRRHRQYYMESGRASKKKTTLHGEFS